MIRHLAKLVWHRKRASALLVLEIFVSFLVVFGVGTLAVYYGGNWRRPLGFDYKDVWSVEIQGVQNGDAPSTPEQWQSAARLLREVRALTPVTAAGAGAQPFGLDQWTANQEVNHRRLSMEVIEATPEIATVLGLELVAGRFFTRADEALPYQPVVLNRRLAEAAFGGEDPIGRRFLDADAEQGRPESRVIGVVTDFRRGGELTGPRLCRFELVRMEKGEGRIPRTLLVKLRPGTPAAFEADLTARLRQVAPDWSFNVQPLARLRESNLRLAFTPLAAAGIVAAFLLAMVALGLLGVLWQNLLRRTREIGLRRALGASRASIQGQIVLEQLLLATGGIGLGLLLAVQIPAFRLLDFIPRPVWLGAAALAAATVYGLITLAALYPSRVAGRIEPAEALRAE